jgi:hypothetical protein
MKSAACQYCGLEILATGHGAHVKSCAKKTPEQRALVIEKIKRYAKTKNLRAPELRSLNGAPMSGGRVQVTISVDLADLKAILGLLIPNISIDKVQMS